MGGGLPAQSTGSSRGTPGLKESFLEPRIYWRQMRRRFFVPLFALMLSTSLIADVGAQPPGPTRPGIDVLLESPGLLQGRRIGLVTHAAGFTSTGETTSSVLLRDPRFNVTALFAPEHGLSGTIPAGQPVPDSNGRVPVYSLYGSTRRPTTEMMASIDVFVVDLQDVGARAYTFASTMALVMQAARDASKPVVVLDRPNPQGGLQVDGPVLSPEFRSFIGMYPIPAVHGMTIGELAQFFNSYEIGADLTIVPMRGWARRMVWEETGLPWVRPSPNITSMVTPFYFSVTGVFDGTTLSNGPGPASAFQGFYSQWLDGDRLVRHLREIGLPGVQFEAYDIGRGERPRRGVRLIVTDALRFKPAETAVHILVETRRLHGDRLQFVARGGRFLFDYVWGTSSVRKDILRGAPAHAIVARWEPELRRFQTLRNPYLIYQ